MYGLSIYKDLHPGVISYTKKYHELFQYIHYHKLHTIMSVDHYWSINTLYVLNVVCSCVYWLPCELDRPEMNQ